MHTEFLAYPFTAPAAQESDTQYAGDCCRVRICSYDVCFFHLMGGTGQLSTGSRPCSHGGRCTARGGCPLRRQRGGGGGQVWARRRVRRSEGSSKCESGTLICHNCLSRALVALSLLSAMTPMMHDGCYSSTLKAASFKRASDLCMTIENTLCQHFSD